MRWADGYPVQNKASRYGDSDSWSFAKFVGVGVVLTDGTALPFYIFNFTSLASTFHTEIADATSNFGVPVELLLACVAANGAINTTTGAYNANFRRELPGFISDLLTPDSVSLGLTGITLGEAQRVYGLPLTASDVLVPATNFSACARSIAARTDATRYDPVLVAAHYNQEGLTYDAGSRWRLASYDGDELAISRFLAGFNVALHLYAGTPLTPSYGAVIDSWSVVSISNTTYQTTFSLAAQTALDAGVLVSSTLHPELNVTWPINNLDAMALKAQQHAAGQPSTGSCVFTGSGSANSTTVTATNPLNMVQATGVLFPIGVRDTGFNSQVPGLLSGGTHCEIVSLNIIGTAGCGVADLSGADHPVSWTSGVGLTDLGLLSGGTSGAAMCMTSDGATICGWSDNRAFSWTSGGGMVDLGVLDGGSFSIATGIDGTGNLIVGYGDDATGETHACLWTSGVIADLGRFEGGTFSEARAISDDGLVIVGIADITAGMNHAFRWTAGGFVDLGVLDGFEISKATAVSQDGSVIVGYCEDAIGLRHAFRWTLSGMTDLGEGEATGVSWDGRVIAGTQAGSAFRWTADTSIVLMPDASSALCISASQSQDGYLFGGENVVWGTNFPNAFITVPSPYVYSPFTPGTVASATHNGITMTITADTLASVFSSPPFYVQDYVGTLNLTGHDPVPLTVVWVSFNGTTTLNVSVYPIYTFPDIDGNATVVVGDALVSLYTALRDYRAAVIQYDQTIHAGGSASLPSSPVVVP